MMEYRVRPAGAEDHDYLHYIIKATSAEQLEAWRWDEAVREPVLELQYNALINGIQGTYPGAEMCIIEISGAPSGLLILHRGPTTFRVIDITVAPEYRNRGIASRILTGIIEEAHACGKSASLQVMVINPAQRLYDRLGFQRTGGDGVMIEMECCARAAAAL